MKKYFCNFRSLAALLMAGVAFAACTSDENSIENVPQPATGEQVYTLTINASNDAASTRALSLDGTKLVAAWEDGDELAVYNVTKGAALTGTLTASNASGATATFSGSLTGTIDPNDKLTLSYHQPTGFSDYANQDGTLASAAGRDYATATVTVASVESGEITTTADASFETQTAVLKLTLTDGTNNLIATKLVISASMLSQTAEIAAFTLSTNTGVLYFALPDKQTVAKYIADKLGSSFTADNVATALSSATLTYTATVGSNTYTATKNGYNFEASKYYAGTLTMTPSATSLTYLKWDAEGKKLVETEIPATATKVVTVTGDVSWEAGTYLVDGNVIINGEITLNGDVELIIKDGCRLIANNVSGSSSGSLSIYGGTAMSGVLLVQSTNLDALGDMTALNIHSCKVTAKSSDTFAGGTYNIGQINVYGGLLDTQGTNTDGYGIYFYNTGDKMNIWGGEVKAKGSDCGILANTNGCSITVHGGKFYAESSTDDNSAIDSQVTLTTGTDFTGTIQTSSDGNTWDVYSGSGTPNTQYVRVGY